MFRRTLVPAALALAVMAPYAAFGHAERHIESQPRPGTVPDQNRTPTQLLDVCKVKSDIKRGLCFEHIQQAVDAAPDGALIRIWPGLYLEEPSLAADELSPNNRDGTFSYDFHVQNPNSENLIAIVGKTNLTLRGMGTSPRDVAIDVHFEKHVGIRGDNADGLIIENLSVWHAFDHGVYVLDTDGFVIDRVHSGYSREYAFLTFANDHGVMKDCEAFGSGDGGLYPGGSADTPGRFSMEIANCRSYHNVLGYSGTQGDHVWVHDNQFFRNAVGLVSDSETDHPNYPQNDLRFERNKVYDNNFNPYAADSDVEATVFAGSILIPVGVGVFLASGNDNLVHDNQVWGNRRFGVWLASGEGLVIGPTSDPPAPPFASSGNRFTQNRMYPPDGVAGSPNGTDFGWDGMGLNNCWEGNARAGGDPATSDGPFLPPCSLPATAAPPNPDNALAQAMLVFVEGAPLCAHTGYEPCVWGRGPRQPARNTPRGHQPPDWTGVECGPGNPKRC